MTSFLTQNGGNKGEKGYTSGWKVINTKRDKKGPVRDTGAALQRVSTAFHAFGEEKSEGCAASWFELIRGTNERAAPTLKRMKRKLFSRRRARFLLLAPLILAYSFIADAFEFLTRGIVVFDHLKRPCRASFPRLWQELNIVDALPSPYSELSRVTWLALPNERGNPLELGIQEVSSRCW